MSVWNYAVSWDKFKKALDCPKQLQYAVDKTPPSFMSQNYFMELGKVVQLVFELYFNQGINLKSVGRTEEVIRKVVAKVLASERFKAIKIDYTEARTEKEFHDLVLEMSVNGLKIFKEMGILDRKIRSEVLWIGNFRNHRIYSRLDFLLEERASLSHFDGKGHKDKNADPRQLLYYSLALLGSGKILNRGGYIYWRHGFEPIDLSPKAMKEFIEGDFAKGRVWFDKLKKGTEDFPATPSPEVCGNCPWKFVCAFSMYKKQDVSAEVQASTDLIPFEGPEHGSH